VTAYWRDAIALIASAIFIVAGAATFWWSGDLMRWLIWMVGEERALGAGNVIRNQSGALLTNPMAMIRWTIPFWIAGFVQIATGMTLAWFGVWNRRRKRYPKAT
jgi:hypothetical protein